MFSFINRSIIHELKCCYITRTYKKINMHKYFTEIISLKEAVHALYAQ